ncbi:MAG: sigma-70 family RNA polymerase sigma factor [candidate division Zixibacteria bacterium]|nr:sigma-70 family RNA polymerase sigma factor [candidate division Zixibacteria bacterium]
MNDTKNPDTSAGSMDELLIRLIKLGDQTALSSLYDRRGRFVYSLALSIVQNEADAEEITEEVFFKLWQQAGSYDLARGSVLAWLTTMSRHLAIDRTRSKQYKARRAETTLDDTILDTLPANHNGSPDSDWSNAEAKDQIVSALNRLTPAHRDVIRLSYYDGLSHSLIAERLDTPLGTVKSRIREAVIQLRKHLKVEA